MPPKRPRSFQSGTTSMARPGRWRRASAGAVVETINLFNKDDPNYTVDERVNHTTGALLAQTGYDASGFIPVKPSTVYRLTSRDRIAWYNEAQVYISGENVNADPTVTSPAGAAFLRCSLFRNNFILPSFFMVTETAAVPSVYVPYGGLVQTGRIRGMGEDAVTDGGITPRKTSFLLPGKNLFNAATITPNSSISAAGTVISNPAYHLSDFIPVTAGLPYVGNGAIRFYAAYDASKTIIQSAGSNTQVNAGGLITPAANVAFLRITTFVGETAAFQFEQNTAQTGYEAHRFTFSPLVSVPPATAASTWQNVRAASYGDSITAGNQWQPGIVTALGLDHTGYGVGGRRIAGPTGMCKDSEINTMPTDRELIMVLGGANDWAQSTALGTPTSTNTNEFYGALNQMCEKLTTRWPAATICLITTGYAEYPTRIVDQGWPNAVTNLVGAGTREYAEAIRVAGKRWGLPVIDMAALEGVNSVNVAAYRGADGALLHPNAAGGARMARVITGVLRTLAPL
jgi:lysophospholipase L1-like esterase